MSLSTCSQRRDAAKHCDVAAPAHRTYGVTLIALVLLLVSQGPTFAQGMVVAEVELPEMLFKLCPTLAAARGQAALSLLYSKLDHESANALEFIHEDCGSMDVVVRPSHIEQSIPPFETWAIAYEKGSTKSFQARYQDRAVTIPYSIRRQRSQFWYANFRHPNGKWYRGWVEIPDEPYLLKWASAQRP